jgi:hypothetical protein
MIDYKPGGVPNNDTLEFFLHFLGAYQRNYQKSRHKKSMSVIFSINFFLKIPKILVENFLKTRRVFLNSRRDFSEKAYSASFPSKHVNHVKDYLLFFWGKFVHFCDHCSYVWGNAVFG